MSVQNGWSVASGPEAAIFKKSLQKTKDHTVALNTFANNNVIQLREKGDGYNV